ncbi:hypothetical protein D1BOALGB6SA_5624 [Olavius sp. associated proteobacterium Delta 1]|nr:hypothetical protein D1BOALGB6SA_5624 [Olavius sp. associated proteobacterium Delta 1]
MFAMLPEAKEYQKGSGKTKAFNRIGIEIKNAALNLEEIIELLEMKLWNYPEIGVCTSQKDEDGCLILVLKKGLGGFECENKDLFLKQGYILDVKENSTELIYEQKNGLVNGLSTLKQLFKNAGDSCYMEAAYIKDWPTIAQRSVSNTFGWYAGYGRLGFDMQLWGYDEWVEYLNICSDFKINQFNMCMYGYWPFEFDEYPETVLRNYRMKVWNKESQNWITVEYLHPNLADEFLSKLIAYGHKLGVSFFAYVGLNSYNGGYPSIYKEKRMKLPAGSKYVNDFDRLCLSNDESIEYLKQSFRKIVQLGYDGIDFEESEEAFWYCDCDNCKENYLKKVNTPEAAKNIANSKLLHTLCGVIREENPNCKIGIRAWRQPPLEKPADVMQEMVSSVPRDVGLFWAPGLYVPDSEFEKWTEAFGKDRIWARDTESNAVSSCFGRLIRIFRSNGLRCEEETNDQFLDEDIRQHIGSAKLGVKGTNGYMFEWYGFFMHLFAHAYYSWGAYREAEDFYRYSLNAVFGEELADDILFVLKNMFTIHESQLKIFPTEFPFARNKVEKKDIPRIEKAIKEWPKIMQKLKRIQEAIAADTKLKVYEPHFAKLITANRRNRVIYDLAIASVNYDHAETQENKIKYLKEMYDLNEREFNIIKNAYFDVNPVSETGTKSCMIPYHELKRVLTNELYPDQRDDEPIYLGVEALGWLWL